MNAYSTMIGAGLAALTIQTKTLADALGAMKVGKASIIEGRNTIPILNCVLLDVRGDCLTITGTDLDMTLSIECPIAGKGDGRVAIEFEALHKAVKAAKGETISIADMGDGRAVVQADNRTAHVITRDAADFPPMRAPDGLTLFELDPDALKLDLDRAASAMSTEETRYYLRGAFFHCAPGDDGQPRLRIASTDGHRLVAIQRPAPVDMPAFPDAIVPLKTAEWLRRKGLKGATAMRIGFTGAMVEFRSGRMRLLSKLVDGTFPDYSRVIPRSAKSHGYSHLITGDADVLADAAKEATAQQTGKTRSFLFSAGKGWGTAYSYCPDNGAASVLVDGTDWTPPTVPGQPQFVTCDHAKAGEFAADLVATLARDAAAPAWVNPATPDNWPDKLVEVQAWLWACDKGSTMTHGRNWVKETVALGRAPVEETGADVWIEEHAVEVPSSRKVWFGAYDGQNGTVLNIAYSQRGIEDWLLEQVGKTREEFAAWDGEQAAGSMLGFDDFLREEADFLDSWSWESFEIPVPGIGQRPRVVVAVEGGLITGASSDVPVDLCTVDYDVEGVDEADIVALPQSGTDETADAYLRGAYVKLDPEWTEAVFAMNARDEAGAIKAALESAPGGVPDVVDSDPAALIGAGLDLIDDVQWTIVEDGKTVRFLALDPETDEPRVFRARIERENG